MLMFLLNYIFMTRSKQSWLPEHIPLNYNGDNILAHDDRTTDDGVSNVNGWVCTRHKW